MNGRPVCYVCRNPIDGKPVAIGPGLDRHIRCAPGTQRWAEATAEAYRGKTGAEADRAREWLRRFGFTARGRRVEA